MNKHLIVFGVGFALFITACAGLFLASLVPENLSMASGAQNKVANNQGVPNFLRQDAADSRSVYTGYAPMVGSGGFELPIASINSMASAQRLADNNLAIAKLIRFSNSQNSQNLIEGNSTDDSEQKAAENLDMANGDVRTGDD